MKSLETSMTPVATSKPCNLQGERDLRYILTQKCNYQCTFCHKEGCDGSEKNLLQSDEYDFLFSTARDALGITQVTLSGGEPMMRRDIGTITGRLHDAGAKVTMVSNGALIPERPEIMKNIDVLNLSLHTTNQELYTTLTGSSTKVDSLIDEITDIHRTNPHLQVKINSAIINGENTPETHDFARKSALAAKHGWKLKYLELSDENIPGFVDLNVFEKDLIKNGFVPDQQTARQRSYTKNGIIVVTGRVFCSEAKQTQNPQGYCKQHNDIYVTPDGYLSSCPMDIKKISAYDAIVTKDASALSHLLQETICHETNYQCPFNF